MSTGATVGTLIIFLLGTVALAAGTYQFLKVRRMDRECSQVVVGRVVGMVDEDAKGAARREAQAKAKGVVVVAANEAIAEKKRAYEEKRRDQARREAEAARTSWRALVAYEVDGEEHLIRAETLVRRSDIKDGQPMRVRYNPADPDDAWLEMDGLPRVTALGLLACGAGLLVVAVMCRYFLPPLLAVIEALLES